MSLVFFQRDIRFRAAHANQTPSGGFPSVYLRRLCRIGPCRQVVVSVLCYIVATPLPCQKAGIAPSSPKVAKAEDFWLAVQGGQD